MAQSEWDLRTTQHQWLRVPFALVRSQWRRQAARFGLGGTGDRMMSALSEEARLSGLLCGSRPYRPIVKLSDAVPTGSYNYC